MNRLQTLFSAISIVAILFTATNVSAANAPPRPDGAPMHRGWHDGPGGPGIGMHRILDQLQLSAAQTAEVKAIFSQARPQLDAMHESGRANREQLDITPPTDPDYAGLVSSAKSNAAEKIQLMSDLWAQVYAKLTPDQRARIPGIVAARQAKWEARASTGQLSHQ